MTGLPIVACGSFVQTAAEPAVSLREPLLAACPSAPRRMNRLAELSLIGAHRAVHGRDLPADTDIMMTFSHGAVADSAVLVRDIVAGQPSMPLNFINMSSNMACFHVAASLGLHSGNQVVASDDGTWETALELALLGRSRGLLLGAAEECAWPLDEHRLRLRLPPGTTLLESSFWLYVDRATQTPVGTIERAHRCADAAALDAFIRTLALPADARLHLRGDQPDAAAHWSAHTGLPLWRPPSLPGRSDLVAAHACLAFLTRERGTLLHLARGETGAWFAVLLRAGA